MYEGIVCIRFLFIDGEGSYRSGGFELVRYREKVDLRRSWWFEGVSEGLC